MMNIEVAKHNLAQELFVRTADENYITARWCAINQLNTDFLWLAVHALEKYQKAVLLVNEISTKGYGHDITKLYQKVRKIAAPLLPRNLEKPKNLSTQHWRNRTPEAFMKHLLRNGNADNRYLIYGYTTFSEDLHMLDAMVFAIRRLTVTLDGPYAPAWNKMGGMEFTNRELLTRQPEWYDKMYLPLDTAISEKDLTPIRQAALNLNFAFAPSDFLHTFIRGGISSLSPVILRRVLDPLESDDLRQREEGIQAAEWLLANVTLPRRKAKSADPDVYEEIEGAIAKAKAKN